MTAFAQVWCGKYHDHLTQQEDFKTVWDALEWAEQNVNVIENCAFISVMQYTRNGNDWIAVDAFESDWYAASKEG